MNWAPSTSTFWLLRPGLHPLALPASLAAEWHAEGKFAGRLFLGTQGEAAILCGLAATTTETDEGTLFGKEAA